jgi:type I restriction enzyme S subunit
MTAQPLSFEIKADIEAAFDESDLPFKVDIVDWAETSESFHGIIDNCKLLLQKGIYL